MISHFSTMLLYIYNTNFMSYRYLFGPVQSRRLKTSLGVDCITPKTCNLDCIYCECGSTTNRTMLRKEYVSASAIIEELKLFLSNKPQLDFITFGGSGEPTLNTKIGEMVSFLKKGYSSYKTALLTNGTLLYLSDVQDAVMAFDCILPSLDAISEKVFSNINRPDPSLDNNKIIEGLVSFSKRYHGMLLVEVFIVPGINDSPDELERFKEVLLRIAPTRVQLNSLDRPGALENVPIASIERLSEIAESFLPLPVEIITRSFTPSSEGGGAKDAEATLISALKRRPMTVEDIAVMTGVTINRSAAFVERLSLDGKVSARSVNGRLFYTTEALP
jgi:wyosine [tRNA(Phe)-imidazoG37] synthetase (radical SAM superfamily)